MNVHFSWLSIESQLHGLHFFYDFCLVWNSGNISYLPVKKTEPRNAEMEIALFLYAENGNFWVMHSGQCNINKF